MLTTLTFAAASGSRTAPEPLFGNQWLALAVILAGVAVFIALVAIAGRILAATHPDDAKVKKVAERAAAASGTTQSVGAAAAALAAPETIGGIAPEILAAISAAVVTVVGHNASIVGVQPVKPKPLSVEMLMQQWSIEGRRQIYSSHQFR
ncbi:hypothetical protein [Geminisphaera colitermitum]|uniref:hypothetical protein n=1 Tax=Geminisphaera colitermitum TaxID=1148786 RepID=UPI000158D2B4|nr:hypothetical protein [Geminisphaera colitermitum]